MDPKPQITPTPESGPKILSFEEFSYRGQDEQYPPHYNNFFLYFSDFGHRRTKDYFLKFRSEQAALATSLCGKVQRLLIEKVPRSEALRSVDRELYEAYKIMRSYGISDRDLFK